MADSMQLTTTVRIKHFRHHARHPRLDSTKWGWRVFHTGTDNHICYVGIEVNINGSLNLGTRQQIPVMRRIMLLRVLLL